MTIARKLAILSILPLTLLILTGMAAAFAYHATADARATSRLASQLETRVFALALLSYDYLQHRKERAREQWLNVHASLGKTLSQSKAYSLAPQAIAKLRADHADLENAFSQLTMSPAPGSHIAERESWLAARLLLYTQTSFTDAVRLRETSERRLGEELIYFSSLTLGLLTALGIFAAIFALRTASGIRSSLRRLHIAAAAIAAGDLDYSANEIPPDEHGELAQALGVMAGDLKKLQQRLIQSEKLSALGILAAGIAHELNNPLMGIMGYVGRARIESGETGVRETLRRAEVELERMRDLLRNMLGFARPIDEKVSDVDIAKVLERATALMEAEFKTRKIRLTSSIPTELPIIPAKEGALQQVFLNLLLNARDGLEGQADPAITINVEPGAREVMIKVIDNGIGIPAGDTARIFDPFFTTKPPGKGTGLGLSISRNIVADLGGTISCDSRPGEGATFTITLPVGDKER